MSWTYDFSTAYSLSAVRLLVGDTDASTPIFQDAEVQFALQQESAQNIIQGLSGFNVNVPQQYNYLRSAALLLRSLSAVKSRSLVRRVLDIQLDTRAAASAIKDLADSYIEQDQSSGAFAVAEMGSNQFWLRERLNAMMLRQLV